jgi:cell division protein FtsL
MIRLGPLLWLALIALASIGTFQLKYRVQAQEQQLTSLDRQIQRDRDAIQVLHAEWAHLNDPARLSDLARRHLDLAPVAGVQIVTFDALPARPANTTPEDPIGSLLSQLGADEQKTAGVAQPAPAQNGAPK